MTRNDAASRDGRRGAGAAEALVGGTGPASATGRAGGRYRDHRLSHSRTARSGRILEVLGPPDAFGVDVEIVIRKHHLPHAFPANVLAEATASSAEPIELTHKTGCPRSRFWDLGFHRTHTFTGKRRDFRGLPIVTIDGETARDFDDAVFVEPLPNGNWQLQVHIADVSHYVRPGTALDLEARLRGTSVYFPDRAIPMLPQQLSSGMCSLRPDEDRLVLSCLMEIDAPGRSARLRVLRGHHPQRPAHDLHAGPGHPRRRRRHSRRVRSPWSPEFEQMHELALKLNAKRHRRGSIDFDLPEPVIEFDPDGDMVAIVRSQRGWSHRLIEEFMLSANECVAHWIEAQGVPSIYRIHEMPDPKRIVEFEETAQPVRLLARLQQPAGQAHSDEVRQASLDAAPVAMAAAPRPTRFPNPSRSRRRCISA